MKVKQTDQRHGDSIVTSDQIIALLASLGACFSAVATFWTVREIKKQREASYRPELALSRTLVECTKDPLVAGAIPNFWTIQSGAMSTSWAGEDGKIESQSRAFSLPLRNIGLGTAKTVSVLWSFPFKNVTKQVNELAQKTLSSAYLTLENDVLSFDSEDLGNRISVWRNQKQETLDYVLPAAVHHELVMLMLPDAYITIVSSLIYFGFKYEDEKSHSPEIPPLIANVEFSDIGDGRHSTKFSIQFNVVATNGEFISGYLDSRKCA